MIDAPVIKEKKCIGLLLMEYNFNYNFYINNYKYNL